MKELMIHVERAVRSIQATQWQKLKIREELLGHLQGVYAEEFEHLCDHDQAVNAAIERFGPAVDLVSQFKASLPWYSFPLSLILQRVSRDYSRPDSLLEISMWGFRLGVLLMILIGIPWYAALVFTGQLQIYEAVCVWTSLTLSGFLLLWPWLGLMWSVQGTDRQEFSLWRVVFFSIASWCGPLVFPVLFWALPWFGPTISDAWFQRDTKLMIFATSTLCVPILIILFARTKSFSNLFQEDQERSSRVSEWEQLDLNS